MSPYVALSEAKQYITLCNIVLGEEIPLYPLSQIRREILNDPYLMKLYGEKDFEKLLSVYNNSIGKLEEILYDEDKEQYILNILEYFKFCCAGEDFIGLPGVLFFERLNNYSFSSSLIGKGTSFSQASLMQELLGDDYIVSEVVRTDRYNSSKEKDRFHVLIKGTTYIDPYHYDGRPKKSDRLYHYSTQVTEQEFDNRKRNKAKGKVSKKLIEKLKIKEISDTLFTKTMTLSEKNDAIIKYILENYLEQNTPVRYYIVEINGVRMEASRVLELFYIANNIPYRIEISDTKENSPFAVYLNEDLVLKVNIHDKISKMKKDSKVLIKQ